MDETWLDKPTGQGTQSGPSAAPRQIVVKTFSFWEPFDAQYVSGMAEVARGDGFAHVSFYDAARAVGLGESFGLRCSAVGASTVES